MGLDIINQVVIISALMHDIGKFAQRAERPYSANLENEYCPRNSNGIATHKHTLYTDYFIESDDFPLPKELLEYRSMIARIASAHHKPGVSSDNQEKFLEEIIQRADCLSSGLDRIEGETVHFKKAHLESIFSHVELRTDKPALTYQSLKELSEFKAIFPCQEKENQKGDYEKLFASFVQDLKQIPLEQGFSAYLSSLVSVLEKYTYCIPSSTYNTTPDISLYDHAVTTSAIAQALYVSCKENKEISLQNQSFLLFSAEFSGIQKYIFSGNASKGIAKILRARSFHLQALTRALILHIVDKLSLSFIAKIMDAGGKFILLLPDTEQVKQQMQYIMQEIEDYFAKEFKGELKAPMALIHTSQKNMTRKEFISKIDEINDILEENKYKPFTHYFKDNSPVFEIDYSKGLCEYCERSQIAIKQEETCCDKCYSLIEIGKVIPSSKLGLFTKNPPKNAKSYKLIGDIYIVLDGGSSFSSVEIQEALDCINLKSSNKYTHYPIAGYIPKDEKDNNLSFSDLANKARIVEDNRCVPMLGILKADVDSLGFIFSLGFNDNVSISRYAQLSRLLNTFFSEHLVQIIK